MRRAVRLSRRTDWIPGEYTISIRAVGYEISVADHGDVVAEKTVTADIELKKTKISPASSPTPNG